MGLADVVDGIRQTCHPGKYGRRIMVVRYWSQDSSVSSFLLCFWEGET